VKRLPAVFYSLPAGREPVRDWLLALGREDHQGCGILLADRLATLSPSEQRLVGSEKQFAERKDRPCSFLRPRGPYGAASRLHKEDSEDTGRRVGSGLEENEGNHMKKKKTVKKGRIGSSFDDFLKDDGTYEEVTARAIKRVIARQLDALMDEQGLTKSELAKRMNTSRAQLDRILDPENGSVTLDTLSRAAKAVGRHLRMELV
jgi:antitoxin HicB